MLTLRAVPKFGFIGFREVPIPGVTRPDEVIDGFPEFSDDLNKIKDAKDVANEQKAKNRLRAVARRIVASHKSGGRKIVGFVVQGHSDQTTRMQAGPQRDQFEQGISEDRAENCKNLLLQMIEEEGGRPFIAGIQANATAQGFGSKHRVFKPAQTVAQMEKNRRVEIFLREFVNPPPNPTPPPPPKPQTPPETGSNWSIQILSGVTTTITTPTDASPFLVVLELEIIDKDRKQKARFRYKGAGQALPSATVGPPTAVQTGQVTQGSQVTFATKRGTTLNNFIGKADVAQNPGAGVSVLSRGGNFVFSFVAQDNIGVFTAGSVVSVDAGQGVGTLPSAGLGAVTTGEITMKSGVQPL